MNWWQIALLVLAVFWALQVLGTWFQMRHYQDVLARITRNSSDGFLGTGNAKSSLGRGLITILVANADGTIRQALAMEGRSVLARFEEVPALQGKQLAELEQPGFFPIEQKARAEAFGKAIAQIREIQQSRTGKSGGGN